MIIIDGYNFLYAARGIEHQSSKIDDLEKARQDLHEQLKRFQNISDEQIKVIYDARSGSPKTPNVDYAGVHIIYAPPNVSADDYIVRWVKNYAHPASVTVVTSDHELGERLKTTGCKLAKCVSFHKRLVEAFEKGEKQPDDKSHEKPGRPNSDEIDFFLRAFTEDKRKPPIE